MKCVIQIAEYELYIYRLYLKYICSIYKFFKYCRSHKISLKSIPKSTNFAHNSSHLLCASILGLIVGCLEATLRQRVVWAICMLWASLDSSTKEQHKQQQRKSCKDTKKQEEGAEVAADTATAVAFVWRLLLPSLCFVYLILFSVGQATKWRRCWRRWFYSIYLGAFSFFSCCCCLLPFLLCFFPFVAARFPQSILWHLIHILCRTLWRCLQFLTSLKARQPQCRYLCACGFCFVAIFKYLKRVPSAPPPSLSRLFALFSIENDDLLHIILKWWPNHVNGFVSRRQRQLRSQNVPRINVWNNELHIK